MMNENPGEIARFRRQQALQEESARSGLYGPAMVASHTMITARMERGADYLLRLIAADCGWQAGRGDRVDEFRNVGYHGMGEVAWRSISIIESKEREETLPSVETLRQLLATKLT
ncbi:MAG TPA: hypothetical protein VNG51_22755 [Ktedonobacteraceae bacterium]|nr:hypothetical protein [Ktedonobacteraceae bacterium]